MTDRFSFPAWKTIELGTHRSIQELAQAVWSNGCPIERETADVVSQVPVASCRTTVDLVRVTPLELGLSGGVWYPEFRSRAMHLGYGTLPAEVGPQLRRQYLDQPRHEHVYVAMEPLTDAGGLKTIFHITHIADALLLFAAPDVFVGRNSYVVLPQRTPHR